jgi:hypothetical protein
LGKEAKLFYPSLSPVIGFPLAMGDRHYPDTAFKFCVKNQKWKPLENVTAQPSEFIGGSQLWILLDLAEDSFDFGQELKTQSNPLILIISNGSV